MCLHFCVCLQDSPNHHHQLLPGKAPGERGRPAERPERKSGLHQPWCIKWWVKNGYVACMFFLKFFSSSQKRADKLLYDIWSWGRVSTTHFLSLSKTDNPAVTPVFAATDHVCTSVKTFLTALDLTLSTFKIRNSFVKCINCKTREFRLEEWLSLICVQMGSLGFF